MVNPLGKTGFLCNKTESWLASQAKNCDSSTTNNTNKNTVNPQKINAWTETRRDIHAHPELRFEELRTSTLIAERLKALGYAVETGLGKTGVVGLLHGTRPSTLPTKMIGLRADMDALPIHEQNAFEHASKHPGKMHACGHDGHVAMLLGAAQELSENRDFSGSVALIFQPAEEGGAGALRMIEDGLFQKYPCDAVFAMHNWPNLPSGEFAAHAGPVMASSNQFSVTIRGKGAHAAMPDLGVDPIIIAAQLIQAYQTIISRTCKPVDAAVLSVTKIHAGEAINAIPDQATLEGTVRTFSVDTLDLIEQQFKQLTNSLCQAHGAQVDVLFKREYPPTINTPSMAQLAQKAISHLPSKPSVHSNLPPSMGAEDFSYMLLQKPGAYLWIGNGHGDHRAHGHGLGPCTLHNPNYDFNDNIIPLGVQAWCAIVQHFLSDAPSETTSLR